MSTVEVRTIKGKSQLVVTVPVLDIESTEDGHALLTVLCSKDADGNFTVCELEQGKLERLPEFQRRMADGYALMKRKPSRRRKSHGKEK